MNLVVVEDHALTRELISKVCVAELGHTIAGTAADAPEAVKLICEASPDIVILDLVLPSFDGFQVIERVRRKAGSAKFLIFSGHCDAHTVQRVERVRVEGFIDKTNCSIVKLGHALTEIYAGRCYFSQLYQDTAHELRRDPGSYCKILSDTEQLVLELVADYLTDAEIARKIRISPRTAENHRFNIQRKLGLGSRLALVRHARALGFGQRESTQKIPQARRA